jgi:hypothetical protein
MEVERRKPKKTTRLDYFKGLFLGNSKMLTIYISYYSTVEER